jgi:hypothetical protein
MTAGPLVALLALACAEGPTVPTSDLRPQATSRAGLECVTLDVEGSAPLGIIPAGYEGAGGLGGLPGPAMFGDVFGTLHSYVTSDLTPVGADGQGAAHITLRHVFTAADPAEGGFYTDDLAVCGPIVGAPGTCRLSDQLTVAGGTGAFEGAAGKLHNRGVLDFNTFMLTLHLTGKVCGAGL